MSQIIIYTIITLVAIGAVAAIVLYFVAQKFKVYEDPRIDQVEEALPAANCGGCGFAGCRNFAEALVKSETFDGLFCPVGGNEVMSDVAAILGREAIAQDPLVAVVRCNGRPEFRPSKTIYNGASSCAVAHALYSGEGGCPFGCLGEGDCVASCDFDAIHMNPDSGLPEVIDEKCTACGACVDACPRDIIELRKKNKKDRKIYVSCINEEKGAPAKKNCSVACIGCSKCFKVCPHDAITMENNLAYIDPVKCRLCRKCVAECPTNAILEINFPPPREKKAASGKKDAEAASVKKEAVTAKKDSAVNVKSADGLGEEIKAGKVEEDKGTSENRDAAKADRKKDDAGQANEKTQNS